MRRYLFVCVVTALAFALIAVFALAQSPSRVAPADPAGSYLQPQSGVQGIQSAKPVAIVANGIAPRALAIDPAGNVYLTNAAAPERIFTLTGLADLATGGTAPFATARLAPVAGNGATGSLGDGGGALAAQFNLKTDSQAMRSGLAVAADGTIFVADTLNSTIRRIAGSDSPEPGVTRSIAGHWAPAQNAQMVEPLGLALDHSGNLYVADAKAGTIDLLPNAARTAPGEQQMEVLAHVGGAASIALTADGTKAFVTSPAAGGVFAIDTQTRAIQPVPDFLPRKSNRASDAACVGSDATASKAQTIQAACPAGVAVDGAGNLFVTDANSGKIFRVDAETSAVSTVASGLRSPGAIRFDRSGNLYVAEQGANRIVKFASMGAALANLTITPPATLPAPPSPRVCPQTDPFNFCDQPLGGATPTQAFTLTNHTTAAVSGLAISFTGSNPGDFQTASSTCGTSLAAGASCAINVDFAPSSTGARSASLSVTDSASDTATATVSGTGDDYQVMLNGSPQEQSVIQGGTVTYNFNIVPDAVFGGAVTIVCPPNLPALSTCTPSASIVTVAPGTPASFSVTFQTTYDGVTGSVPTNGLLPVLISPRNRNGRGAPPLVLWAIGIIVLLTFATYAIGRLQSGSSPMARLLPARTVWLTALLLSTCAFAVIAGCKHSSVPANLNTPVGTTNLTIQATAQNAGRGITIILAVTGRG